MSHRTLNARYFPYNFKYDQEDFLQFLQTEINKKHVVISAPTGYGKTPLILAGLLPLVRCDAGAKIVWAVRTGNETDRPIEELKIINEKNPVSGISFRGKKDMCLLQKEVEGEMDHEEVAYFCRYRRRDCPYYKGLFNSILPNYFEPLTYSEILMFCERNEICPYYYQLELIEKADVVAVNYNYILNEHIAWVLKNRIRYDKSFLIVDEAHNLQQAYSSINSKRITLNTIRNAIRELDKNFSGHEEVRWLLERMFSYFENLQRAISEGGIEDQAVELRDLLKYCDITVSYFNDLVYEVTSLGNELRSILLNNKKTPRSSLHSLGDFWIKALDLLSESGVVLIANPEGNGNISVEIFDMRSAELLSSIWSKFRGVVFCSGTLGPPKAFGETVGLNSFSSHHFSFKLGKDNCMSLITLRLTSEGEELSEEMSKKYLEAIDSFLSGLRENVAIFSASYRIQNDLIRGGLLDIIEKSKRVAFIEEKGMSGDLGRKILDDFKGASRSDKKGVLLATAGGRFAEGTDFPGRELVGIFLVGVPFDRLTSKTKLYIDYYRKMYGVDKGEFYSYVLPAVRRASQALGRAIRSSEDRAVFVLGDRRYKRFLNLLPRFVTMNYKKIINHMRLGAYAKEFYYMKANVN